MSWKPEVIADNSGAWCSNALRFETQAEAEANVRDLSMRWTAVRDTRATESPDPVNARYDVQTGRVEDLLWTMADTRNARVVLAEDDDCSAVEVNLYEDGMALFKQDEDMVVLSAPQLAMLRKVLA